MDFLVSFWNDEGHAPKSAAAGVAGMVLMEIRGIIHAAPLFPHYLSMYGPELAKAREAWSWLT